MLRVRIVRAELAAALREHPLHQRRLAESPLPNIVVYTRILSVKGPTACFPSCRNTVTRHGHRNGLIGIPVKVPNGRINRSRAIIGRDTSAAAHRCGEKRRTMRDHMPGPRATHGLPCYTDAALIDGELVTQAVDNLQSQPCPVP